MVVVIDALAIFALYFRQRYTVLLLLSFPPFRSLPTRASLHYYQSNLSPVAVRLLIRFRRISRARLRAPSTAHLAPSTNANSVSQIGRLVAS